MSSYIFKFKSLKSGTDDRICLILKIIHEEDEHAQKMPFMIVLFDLLSHKMGRKKPYLNLEKEAKQMTFLIPKRKQ